jgi:hypothetical protein
MSFWIVLQRLADECERARRATRKIAGVASNGESPDYEVGDKADLQTAQPKPETVIIERK